MSETPRPETEPQDSAVAEAESAPRERRKVRRVLGETTYVELRVALTIGLALVAGGFTIGRLVSQDDESPELADLRQEVVSLKAELEKARETETSLALDLIGNLGLADHAVLEWVEDHRSDLTNSDLGIYFNVRGFSIYDQERNRAKSSDNAFRRDEIQRALDWFGRALDHSPNYDMAIWNSACMHALLGNAQVVADRLDKLWEVLRRDHRERFRKRICTDTDLCPISAAPPIVRFLGTIECNDYSRECPSPPVRLADH